MDLLAGMRLFAEVVDAGSFSAAGRRLGLVPSSVSRQISGLENTLGARLVNRSTRKLSLTEAGRLYYGHAARILLEVEEANRAISHLEAAPRGVLRVNAPIGFGRLHVAPAIRAFLDRYPGLSIDLTLTDNFVDLVEEGADVAIRVGELADSSLIARRLAPNRRVIAASPEYLERRGEPVKPEDLAEHNCLIYKRNEGNIVWKLKGPSGGVIEVPVSGTLQTNSTEALHAAGLAGLGLVLLPTWLIGGDLQAGRLRPVMCDYLVSPTAIDTAIHAVYPHNRNLSVKVRAFVDFLVETFGTRPYWEDQQVG